MTVYAVLVTYKPMPGSSLMEDAHVSQVGYTTLEAAQKFCAGRSDVQEQTGAHKFVGTDWRGYKVEYNIKEITVPVK